MVPRGMGGVKREVRKAYIEACRRFYTPERVALDLMKKAAGLLGLLALTGLILWIGWEFQPWMPAGRAVFLSGQDGWPMSDLRKCR